MPERAAESPPTAGPLRVLIIEDWPSVREVMSALLRSSDFEVIEAGDGRTGLALAEQAKPDAILLDVQLPDMSGLDVLAAIRATSAVPIILVTGSGAEDDRVSGLDAGADDYVVKPFHPGELAARVRAAVRRSHAFVRSEKLTIGDLSIDFLHRSVEVDGRTIDLRRKEFDLLAVLAGNPDRTFSRDDLLHEVWASKPEWQHPGTVAEHIRRLRIQIEVDASAPRWIITVRGQGYRFAV